MAAGAHANAPSHVSAVMSGVMLKMGVYGIVRAVALLPVGEVVVGWRAAGGRGGLCVGGIAFAIGQRDVKRLLAYSSIENIGIIALGLGLALTGRAEGRGDWVALGLCGALLHVWNHGLFKGLLFLNAGALIHAAGTRDMEAMGGLGKRAPRMMALFAVGAVSICALPPFNGFVGEWLLYAGFFRAAAEGAGELPAVSLAAVALAMTGALAVACFVNMLGRVYLGAPRSETCRHMHEPGAAMFWPMVLLAVGCAGVGLFPAAVMMPLEAAAAQWGVTAWRCPAWRTPCLSAAWLRHPAHWPTGRGTRFSAESRGTRARRAGRPDLGLRLCAADRSHAVQRVFVRRQCGEPCRVSPVAAALPDRLARSFPARFIVQSLVPDTILDRLLLPVFRAADRFLPRLRVMQQGRTHVYVFYILAIMIVLLLWGGAGSH
jgi:hypothetical protein